MTMLSSTATNPVQDEPPPRTDDGRGRAIDLIILAMVLCAVVALLQYMALMVWPFVDVFLGDLLLALLGAAAIAIDQTRDVRGDIASDVDVEFFRSMKTAKPAGSLKVQTAEALRVQLAMALAQWHAASGPWQAGYRDGIEGNRCRCSEYFGREGSADYLDAYQAGAADRLRFEPATPC